MEAPPGPAEAGRRRSVGSLLRFKAKKHKQDQRDSDSATHSASETSSLEPTPATKASTKRPGGFLRRMKKHRVKDSDTETEQPSAPVQGKQPSRAATLVRKLNLSRSRKTSKEMPPSSSSAPSPVPADPETSDDEEMHSNASSTAHEFLATPADTPPPPSLTPPPMEAVEDQYAGGAGAGGGESCNPGRRESPPLPAAPAAAVALPPGQALVDEAPQDDDMKGDRRPTTPSSSATGAIKKVPRVPKTSTPTTSSSQSLVDEEKKSTRSQLLSITTPALQKQLNGQAAAAAAAAAAKGKTSTSTNPSPSKSKQGDDDVSKREQPSTPPATTEIRIVAEVVTANGSSGGDVAPDGAPVISSSAPLEPGAPPMAASTGDLMADARNKLSQSLGVHDSAQMSGEKREHLYKILVIGELGTGKTSIIKRYVHQFFSQHYRATIGVDFALKVLNWDASTIIRLQLWDIAGQERFGNMTRVYYKEAVGAFIVFDVTRAGTFDAVVKWKQDLDSKVQMYDGSPIPCVLLANKCDQQKEGLVNSPAKMDDYCREKGFTSWFETSAKENVNIEEAARALVSKILQNEKLLLGNDVKDPAKIALDNNGKAGGDPASAKSCAC